VGDDAQGHALVLHWNGSSWLPQVSANAGVTDNLLGGASRIPGSSSVWAVGFTLTSGDVDRTLIERGAG
jgi:hypothetical protein